MAKKKGFMANVSTENKISITVCLIIVIAIVVYVFSSSTSNALLDSGSQGKVEINVNTSTSNIDEAKDGDEYIIESEVIQGIYDENREQKLKEAKNGGMSYIEKLSIENDEKISAEIEDDLRHVRNQEGIDSILSIDSELEIDREKAELERKRQELSKNSQIAPAPQVQEVQVAKEPQFFFDKKAFLQQEMQSHQKKMEAERNVKSQAVNKLAQENNKDIALAGSYAGGAGAITSSSRANDGSATSRLKNGGYSEMIEKGKQAKYAEMNELRRANGGITNNPTSTSDANNSKSEAYIDMTDPAGFQDNSSSDYITAGSIYYAVLEIGINTDEISPVRATIIQESPVKGATLLGTPERRGSKAIIAFNSMSLNGKDYSISGVALDLETMRTGIADSVDHHTFERYSKLMGAAFISGYAESLSGTTTKTYSDGSTEKIIDAIPDTEDQIAYAIGQAGEKLVPIFEEEFNRKPTVEVNSNREIAIMFMSGIEVGETTK